VSEDNDFDLARYERHMRLFDGARPVLSGPGAVLISKPQLVTPRRQFAAGHRGNPAGMSDRQRKRALRKRDQRNPLAGSHEPLEGHRAADRVNKGGLRDARAAWATAALRRPLFNRRGQMLSGARFRDGHACRAKAAWDGDL
jgi:hypothetical protein